MKPRSSNLLLLPIIALCAAVGVARPHLVRAEEAPELSYEQQEIEEFLLEEGYFLESDGFTFERILFGSGPEGPVLSEELLLTEGMIYAFLAKCEIDTCVGLSLSLSDTGEILHTETNEEYDFVSFGFQPTETDHFTIGVEIFTCREAPCDVGLALYRGPGLESELP